MLDFNRIGIIGAMEVEIEMLLDKILNLQSIKYGMFNFFKGKFNEKEVVIVKSGAGKVNSSSCVQMMIDKFDVDCVINTGIAGGIYKDLNICDVVISSEVTYHDVNPVFMKDFFPFKEWFKADKNLIDISKNAMDNLTVRDYKYFVGRIVSGDRFVNDSDYKNKIIEKYEPLCVEMEGASIGHVCYLNSIPFVVIRSISDKADDNASETYEEFERKAADQSASLIIEMIRR